MTKEEKINYAIKELKGIIEFEESHGDRNYFDYCGCITIGSAKMAIKALEQQTCEDAVSRQAAIDAAINGADDWDGGYSPTREEYIKKAIKALPPINPQPNTGHWEKMVEVYDLQQNRMLVPYGYDDAKFGNTPVYVCDCGCKSNKNSRFCPDCGAKMIESQESEVQE